MLCAFVVTAVHLPQRCAAPRVPVVPVEPSLRGRRLRMLVPKFGMGKGDTGVIMGPSKSKTFWELDNGKTILKDHKGVIWTQI